jgi:HSP20 family protein
MEDTAMLPTVKSHRSYFPNLIDEFLNDELWPVFNGTANGKTRNVVPAVNITENDKAYNIEVAAPGLAKNDFNVNLEENVLTISSEKEEKNEEKNDNYVRREFSYNNFRRSFVLPESVNAEKIEASHKDGILNISIPKEEVKKLTKSIKIS